MTGNTTHTARPTASAVLGDLDARHQTITGLRALADFLETTPAVPVNKHGHDLLVCVRTGDDTSAAALVDQVAALLGVEVADERDNGGHYTATRTFGRISYSIVHIPDRSHREFHARTSYESNIRLDNGQDNQGQGVGEIAGRVA
ncbi:hypothetical protein [Actinomadura macra]|uniref:hypothetical protein n=1 Tax=Actinomadura macra TaxID=46164 RepID=UPI00082EDC48|nr:hypothetical protein [Actinomadura macra]